MEFEPKNKINVLNLNYCFYFYFSLNVYKKEKKFNFIIKNSCLYIFFLSFTKNKMYHYY